MKDNNMPWPIWAAVTIIVAVIGAYAVISGKGGDKNNPTVVVTPMTERSSTSDNLGSAVIDAGSYDQAPKINYDREEGGVKSVIRLASNLEAAARRTLNTSNLSQVYSGDALKIVKSTVSQLRNDGVFELNALESQDFGDIDIRQENGKLYAEVELDETWSIHFHRIGDNLCLSHVESHNVPQTVYLEKRSSGWIITSVSFQDDTPPNLINCGTYYCPGVGQ